MAFTPKPQSSGPAGPASPCVAGLRPGPSSSLSRVLASIGIKTFSPPFGLAHLICPAPGCVTESVFSSLPPPSGDLRRGRIEMLPTPVSGKPWLAVCPPEHLAGLQNSVSLAAMKGGGGP